MIQSLQKKCAVPLGDQTGKQLLIRGQTQIQTQLILKCFQRGVFFECRERCPRDIDHHGFNLRFFHQRHTAQSGALPFQNRPPGTIRADNQHLVQDLAIELELAEHYRFCI